MVSRLLLALRVWGGPLNSAAASIFPKPRRPVGGRYEGVSRDGGSNSLQVLCFLPLSYLEPGLFLLHFYQTFAYLAILILLFYREDRWPRGSALSHRRHGW